MLANPSLRLDSRNTPPRKKAQGNANEYASARKTLRKSNNAMRSLLSACVLITSLSLCRGQGASETAGYPVILTDSKTGRSNYAHATHLAKGQLVLAASNGTIAIPANTISAADFDLPAPVRQALKPTARAMWKRPSHFTRALNRCAAWQPCRNAMSLKNS